MPRRPTVPAYRQGQLDRKKRRAAQQRVRDNARRRLPWALAVLALVEAVLIGGAGLLGYRSSRTLADLTRADGVLSWVEIRRSAARYHPYILRFATYEQNRIREVYLGQNAQLAARYRYHLHVGDSVRVYYEAEGAAGTALVHQLEKSGRVLLSAEKVRAENRVGALAFGLLALLPMALLLLNQGFRTTIKSYFRSRPA